MPDGFHTHFSQPVATINEGVTSTVWAEFEQARAEHLAAGAVTRSLESDREADGKLSAAFRAAEERENDLWTIAYETAVRAYRAPAVTAADVLGKARVLAVSAIEIDDWEDADGDLVEMLVRDLAAAHGVTEEVDQILAPAIATRDRYRAARDGNAEPASVPEPTHPDAELLELCDAYHRDANVCNGPDRTDTEADVAYGRLSEAIDRIERITPRTPKGFAAKMTAVLHSYYGAVMGDNMHCQLMDDAHAVAGLPTPRTVIMYGHGEEAGRVVTFRALGWIEAADNAGMNPTAVIDTERGREGLFCEAADVGRSIAPSPAIGELMGEVIDALVVKKRVFYPAQHR